MNTIKVCCLIFTGALLSACGSEGYTVTPVVVTAQSGSKVELTGSWRSACHSSSSDYIVNVRVYTVNGRVSESTEKYAAADSSCNTLISTDRSATDLHVTVGADKTVLGWRDGAGSPASAPTDQSGSVLSGTPMVTKYSWLLTSGAISRSISLIDDSVTDNWVMYVADSTELDADGYPDYLATANPLFKQ